MKAIFEPESIAVIGASDNEQKLGFHIMKSLTQGKYPGKIFPINPSRHDILGIEAYPSLFQIPGSIDLAVIVLPAEFVPRIIKECGEKGVRGIVIISAGFRELEDERGHLLQRELADLANQFNIKIIGPNTFGISNLHLPLNATFTPEFSSIEKGGISLVTQSGGMSHMMAFVSIRGHVGYSKIVGVGNRCNVDFHDIVEYLIEDPETKVIAIYMEGTNHPRKLMDVAKRTMGQKPILVYKAGRSHVSDKASQFHTGSLAGKHDIYEGAFRQTGILSVRSSEELIDAAKALAMCPIPEGGNVAVLSSQAGPGMVICDVCAMEKLYVPTFSDGTQERINQLLPPLAIRTNPVDMGPAWYDSDAIKGIVEAVLEDKKINALVLNMSYASANRASARTLTDFLTSDSRQKPVTCCFSSPLGIWDDEIKQLEASGIANYPTPERAAKALAHLVLFQKIRKKGGAIYGRK